MTPKPESLQIACECMKYLQKSMSMVGYPMWPKKVEKQITRSLNEIEAYLLSV